MVGWRYVLLSQRIWRRVDRKVSKWFGRADGISKEHLNRRVPESEV